ncbi:MAG: GNAT family N-acetyltransferase [Pseudomonadales bacterium]
MNIQLVNCRDLEASAQLTLDNMQPYYQMYGVDWGVQQISSAIAELMNYDILYDGKVIGALRLSFADNECQLRDIQIAETHKGRGAGGRVIAMVQDLAAQNQVHRIVLKVFQCSPAAQLYPRHGFTKTGEDERFFYMSATVSK